MDINFVLGGVGISGGARVVFEYANRLSERNHSVNILYPTIPPRLHQSLIAPDARATQILETVRRYMKGSQIDWFEVNVPVKQIPTLSPSLTKHIENSIPDADITIATSWKTAFLVDNLSDSKGEKSYFIQHYEIWDTWNSEDAWEKVASYTENSRRYPIEMYEVTPDTYRAKKQKKLVDKTYVLPLSKITISSWLSNLLEQKFNQDVAGVITNSVNHSQFYYDPTENSNTTSILFPYRKSPWKGKREVREVTKEIIKRHNVNIHTFGSGLESELSSNITHHPDLSDEELRHLYSNSDIFVLPSWVEGCQLPPLEAMACKCAVVATNVGGIPDYAKDGENASIVPPRNSSALTEAVSDLISNSNKRQQLKQKGYRSVNGYSWEDATNTFEEKLVRIIKS